MKYEVEVKVADVYTVCVEADDVDDAEMLAYKMVKDGRVKPIDADIAFSVTDPTAKKSRSPFKAILNALRTITW